MKLLKNERKQSNTELASKLLVNLIITFSVISMIWLTFGISVPQNIKQYLYISIGIVMISSFGTLIINTIGYEKNIKLFINIQWLVLFLMIFILISYFSIVLYMIFENKIIIENTIFFYVIIVNAFAVLLCGIILLSTDRNSNKVIKGDQND